MQSDNILEYMPVGVILYNAERQVTYANKRASDILSLPLDEVARRSYESPEWHIVNEKDEPMQVHQFPVHITLSEQVVARDILGVVYDGKPTIWIRVISVPYQDGAMVCFWEDSERVEWRREVEAIREQHLIAAAALAHESRTPLAIAMGNLDLMLLEYFGELSKKQHEILQDTVLPKMKEQERIIRYCLALWMGEEKPKFEFSSVDPGSLLSKVIKDTQAISRGKHSVRLVPQVQRGIHIKGHADMITWSCANLIINAMKFTPENGTIWVTGAIADGFYQIEVKDTGIGIPESDLKKIFEPFYQVSRGDNRKYGGLGMGLTAAKTFCDLHHADITVHSILGEGSTFTIKYPLG